ncbi:hypothetical protein Maes01_02272 [Microbulbifer aestuariivivens]|uniref:PepSY domain-containing protein n=1 Tax=Microbulbifer aestuariivivens TaxID=1908308 RepID=A0ABP9WU98_9GAMM
MKHALWLALTLTAAILPLAAAADDKPPPGAMALSTVLTALEQRGYTPIVEVSLDDERWEIEAYKEGKPVKLKVNPNTGEILSEQSKKPEKNEGEEHEEDSEESKDQNHAEDNKEDSDEDNDQDEDKD